MNNENPAIETNEEYKEKIIKTFADKPKEIELDKKTKENGFTNTWNMNNKIVELFSKKIEEEQKLRSIYARRLLAILGIELIGLIIIFILSGNGVLVYSDTALNIFITGGIAEIFLLVRVIVQYLFKDDLTDALNIIITLNNNKKFYRNNKNNKNINNRKNNKA